MRAVRPLLFALLPLFASCQVYKPQSSSAATTPIRLQGELSVNAGQLLLRPCDEQRQLTLGDDGSTSLARDVAGLLADGPGPLFVDLSGIPAAGQGEGAGRLKVSQVYRLQREGHGCNDPDLKRLLLRASGNEPSWNVKISSGGMVIERPGQPPLALPYVEEQLPEGRFDFSSEANGERVQLWVAPQHCVDSMSGAVHHLSAELRIDGQVQRGCAAYGGQLGN
ncbi:COG3650 family protein [Zestomonas carbonaria]|uniref:Lipoprotein n=1 Tax=Zestomonas carbonaria TaxID=2762745 RepID=A0A7U7IAA0_9GAMM|nr:hypothetical protein [Pseudomonas carbonaria]CAD5109239.1 hypothetical protein PSEWESI4_03535 [Pseudomonas carbonaria]